MDKYLQANAIFSLFCKAYTELKKELPIRPSEMGVLNIIVQREGIFTPLMLAEMLDVSKPMITAHIKVLERKGYIYKKPSAEDSRSFYVLPTSQAKELVAITSETMNSYLCQIENALGVGQFELLVRLLQEANRIIKDIEGEP